jgi:DNA helicase II / ATP-dependent DNA helicase PcrA
VQAYLQELNEVQRQAVLHTEGPSLVIAGAGSGKTRVLTFRIAHMLHEGKHPSEILALTFTNKAAREMKNRIASLIGDQAAKYLWMGTFHSIFAKILRYEAKSIGYPSNFTIYDAQDSKNLIKSIVKELQFDPNYYKPSEILGRISFAKNNLITASAYGKNAELLANDRLAKRSETFRVYQMYENRCKASSVMDFDDILMKTNYLFIHFPEILKKYQEKFRYILVDEYQDTNFSQYMIITKLAEAHCNICVVGDDAQSIYAFRGARIENILNFRRIYPENRTFKLEQNYRSTQLIVNAANSVIAKNTNQIRKTVFSRKETGSRIALFEAYTDHEEAYTIANMINDIHLRLHTLYSGFALLYRTNAQSRILEEAMRKKNIPYQIFGGISFYQRKEIKDLLAYFRLVLNPNDDEAFKRIVNYPKRGIGETSLEKLETIASQKGISIWQAATRLSESSLGIGAAAQGKIIGFLNLIMPFRMMAENLDAFEVAKQIAISSGILKELYSNKSPEEISRYENVQELLNGVKDFTIRENEGDKIVTLAQYLENISLLTNEEKPDDDGKEKVSLMTIHSAKGLEFKHVFIAGVEEDLFPSKYSVDTLSDIEEERRLFYVAITRAEHSLCISYARTRYRWGQPSLCQPSRFIRDIPDEFFEHISTQISTNHASQKNNLSGLEHMQNFSQTGKKFQTNNNFFRYQKSNASIKNTDKQADNTSTENQDGQAVKKSSQANYKIGDVVMHERFGTGTVLNIEGNFPETKLVIDFQDAGKKNILVKFAKLKKLSK